MNPFTFIAGQQLIDGIGIGDSDVEQQHLRHVTLRERPSEHAHATQLFDVRLDEGRTERGHLSGVGRLRAAREGSVVGPVIGVDGYLRNHVTVLVKPRADGISLFQRLARRAPPHTQQRTASNEEAAARRQTQRNASVGVVEHGNSAVLVTVAAPGELLDRRHIDLTERGLPTHPHHHEGSWAVGRYVDSPWARSISLADALVLVERVRESAARGARESLEALAAAVPVPISSIAIRACPPLPATTEERIADNRAQTVADSVMYREALATAAEARGWTVHWYDRKDVFRNASAALGGEDIDAFLHAMGRLIGPPWQAKHKLAAAAALAVL